MTEWITNNRKLRETDEREACMQIHEFIDYLCTNSLWEQCDSLIRVIDPATDSIDAILSVLVATCPASEHLVSRKALYDASYGRLSSKVTTYGVLDRLKGE